METEFKVKVGQFEGPLEILLDLIEKRKLHISDVSLATVAEDFIDHMKDYEVFPMADSADFVYIASTLLLIKSKSLLPNLELTEEEESAIEDLEERLSQYKKYKALAIDLNKMFGHFLYLAKESKTPNIIFSPTNEITLDNLYQSMARALSNVPKIEKMAKITVHKVISLEEMMENLSKRIKENIKTTFREFSTKSGATEAKSHKIHVIVSFLAMLELVKRGVLEVSQNNHFADIEMETQDLSVPRY